MSRKQLMLVLISFAIILGAFLAMQLLDPTKKIPTSVRTVLASDVDWQALNPLRGDKSPKAGTLWGDRGAAVPCGFLVKFIDGFSSPPHIHPVTYRGVVISGLVHNDDPKADETWLPTGSFWTQPAGDIHITAVKGVNNVAYIEIEKGPYLVLPSKEAFKFDEQPIWMNASDMPWRDIPGIKASTGGPTLATLPGNPNDEQLRRALVKFPAGFKGSVISRGSPLHGVVINGELAHNVKGETAADSSDTKTLKAGGYFGSEGNVTHHVDCSAGECTIYVRTKGEFDVTSAVAKN